MDPSGELVAREENAVLRERLLGNKKQGLQSRWESDVEGQHAEQAFTPSTSKKNQQSQCC